MTAVAGAVARRLGDLRRFGAVAVVNHRTGGRPLLAAPLSRHLESVDFYGDGVVGPTAATLEALAASVVRSSPGLVLVELVARGVPLPWTGHRGACQALHALHRLWADAEPTAPAEWPDGLQRSDVREWASEATGLYAPDGSPWPGGAPASSPPDRIRVQTGATVPVSLVAWLLAVARDVQRASAHAHYTRAPQIPRPASVLPLAADITTARVARGIATPERVEGDDGDDGAGWVIARWEGGAPGQLQLPSTGPGAALLGEVGRLYGSPALAHLWACVTLQWASNAAPRELFAWFACEHRWLLGEQPDTGRARSRHVKAQREAIEQLRAVRLTATYSDGERVTGPLVELHYPVTDRRGALLAGSMLLHPSIVRAVVAGGQWWPAPLRLLRSLSGGSADARRAVVLAVHLSQQWSVCARARRPVVFARSLVALADLLRLPHRKTRGRDPRTVRAMTATLAHLKRAGLVDRFDVGATVRAWPAIDKARKPPRWPPLPATGEQLAAWLEVKGWSRADAARTLGVHPRTIARGLDRRDRFLPGPLRGAFRAHLWRSDDGDDT